MSDDLRQILLETIEASLQAQLSAVRRLRSQTDSEEAAGGGRRKAGRSQVSIVFDILEQAKEPLHITEIIERAQNRFHQNLDRESLVSALTKRVTRGDRFIRTAPNTFGLLSASSSGKEEG